MPMPNPQPTLPVETVTTDLEQLFISEQPAGILPENQNSNFGTLRKVLTDEMQIALDQITTLFANLFIATADTDGLTQWETELGLPNAAGSRPDARRRTDLGSHRSLALFTRTRRRLLVEKFITDTFGAPPEFSPGGISLVGGIPLASESSGSIDTLYNIIEDIPNFSYEVQISNSVDPDIPGLTRELLWMTPAHISFTITRFAVVTHGYGSSSYGTDFYGS
jgi:hypothetical protein